ncbi:ferric-chelate reductase 1 isoform X1 [Hydra vulgaris]|uniref:ferric-chelate reductase 1 isoform X1 n=1 Tax=Hydra vulgaris TaxID=6087 RepID=UPI001F5E5146|nr:ferric-chelate reductase 1 isoform X1 [Hydra vulgaris]
MVFLIIFASLLLPQLTAGEFKITTEDCYKTADCFLLPDYCTSSDNCYVIIKYQFNSFHDEYFVTLFSSEKWVGFAQTINLNMAIKMKNIKGEICFNNNSIATLASFYALHNSMPSFSKPVNGLKVEETYVLPTGGVVCKYSRSLFAPVESEKFMYSLNESVNLVYAYGVKLRVDGYPSYHGPNNHSYLPDKIDMRKIRTRDYSLFDFSKCGKEFNCFQQPPGCTDTCNAAATFLYDSNSQKIVFQLWASKSLKWVAFGQKPNNNGNFMIKVRGEYCIRLPTVGFGNFNGNNLKDAGTPQWVSEVEGVKLHSTEVMHDGSILCRYERPLKLSSENENYLYDMNEPLYAALAFGDILSGNFPDQHADYIKSSGPIDFKVVQDISFDTISIKLIKAHGSLMVLAWIFFIICGIFTSRYMKPILTSKIAGKDAWFRIHQSIMIIGLLCMISGFVIILVHFNGKLYLKNDIHHWLGFTAIILGLLQPTLAIFRCAPDHSKRYLFNWIHRFIGMSAWLIAVSSIVFGLKKLSLNFIPAIAFAGIVLVLFIGLDLIQLSSQYKCFFTNDQNMFESESYSILGNGEKKKNPACHYIFMATIYAMSCAVAVFYVFMIIKY